MEALESLASAPLSLAAKVIFLVGPMFPGLVSKLPDRRKGKKLEFAKAFEKVAMGLLERQMAVKDEAAEDDLDQSIIGSFGE